MVKYTECTAFAMSSIRAGLFSIAFPTTTISAPAGRFHGLFRVRIPPPAIKGGNIFLNLGNHFFVYCK